MCLAQCPVAHAWETAEPLITVAVTAIMSMLVLFLSFLGPFLFRVLLPLFFAAEDCRHQER